MSGNNVCYIRYNSTSLSKVISCVCSRNVPSSFIFGTKFSFSLMDFVSRIFYVYLIKLLFEICKILPFCHLFACFIIIPKVKKVLCLFSFFGSCLLLNLKILCCSKTWIVLSAFFSLLQLTTFYYYFSKMFSFPVFVFL